MKLPRATHLDLTIDGSLVYLWRAVDAEDECARRAGPDQEEQAGGAQIDAASC